MNATKNLMVLALSSTPRVGFSARLILHQEAVDPMARHVGQRMAEGLADLGVVLRQRRGRCDGEERDAAQRQQHS